MSGFPVEPLDYNEECPICGADIGPSSTFPWHLEDEDCRAVRDPLIGPTIVAVNEGAA